MRIRVFRAAGRARQVGTLFIYILFWAQPSLLVKTGGNLICLFTFVLEGAAQFARSDRDSECQDQRGPCLK